jgi:hypothetical protein
MAIPDFSKPTIDTLAKRARFQCSNPDCGVHTIGPNTDPQKATTIGEAAHILGARPNAKRYDPQMSDTTRAAITNGLWLCRNCHGKIDKDETKYSAPLLFAWRSEHEAHVAKELGTRGERLRHETKMGQLSFLSDYSPIVQRIAIDQPEAWEWRLTAELMREINKPHLKRLKNLQAGHYYKPSPRIDDDDVINWMQERTHIMSRLVEPLTGLMDRMTASWGAQGEPGDIEEIHDVCLLVRDALKTMVDFEETVHFANVPEEADNIRLAIMNAVGNNAEKLSEIPGKLDEAISMIGADHGGTKEEPHVLSFTLIFDLPDDFADQFNVALRRYERSL